jgi:RNA polymerase subunit RPABC4/transcription elongation factor Spt4
MTTVATGSETFCAACGVLSSMARSRCRECGKPLHAPTPGPAPVPVPEVFGMRLGEDEVVCRGCHRISPKEEEWCAGCERRLRLPEPVASPPSSAGRTRVCPRCRRINGEGATFCRDCGGALVREGDGYAPAPKPPVPDPAVTGLCCPACGTAMRPGEAALGMNYRRLATWFVGSSWLELFFRRAGEQEKEWLMRPGAPSAAARCDRCGGVWLSLPGT